MSMWDDSEHPDTQKVRDLKAEIERLRATMQEACELLTERKHGSPARSPAHNARLRLEAALEDTAYPLGEIDGLMAQIERLRAIIDAAMQRLNESGTGEMGVVETIHATHDILRQAREQKR